MDDLSYFESRPGNLTCTGKEIFNFVTDIRNFEQFIPQGTVNNWKAEKESCSFDVSVLGTVSFSLKAKEMYNKVVYTGNALKKNDFSLELHISENVNNKAAVKVLLSAGLNPMMKMMAAKPIVRFLEILINEMESFKGWKETRT